MEYFVIASITVQGRNWTCPEAVSDTEKNHWLLIVRGDRGTQRFAVMSRLLNISFEIFLTIMIIFYFPDTDPNSMILVHLFHFL